MANEMTLNSMNIYNLNTNTQNKFFICQFKLAIFLIPYFVQGVKLDVTMPCQSFGDPNIAITFHKYQTLVLKSF